MKALFDHDRRAMSVAGVELEIDAIQRSGPREPIVFLHGFGSTKEDYADIVFHQAFDDRPFLAYDAPGCGRSHCADLDRLSILFLVDVALGMIDGAGLDRVHLVGHSMGGLTGLMLADAHPERVLSFTSIEGNLAPEDCFLSRQILTHADPDPDAFLDAFGARALTAPAYASALFAAGLKHKVRAGAVAPIFRSMVHLSDEAGLMERFLGLPCHKMFMHGSQNANLSYLPSLRGEDVRLAEISECGHFPMYSNASEMWMCLSAFLIAESA